MDAGARVLRAARISIHVLKGREGTKMTSLEGESLKPWALTGAAVIAMTTASANAQGAGEIEFDIEAKPLADALTEFGLQSDVEVLFNSAELNGKRTDGLEGQYASEEAIEILLNDTGVNYIQNADGTLLVGNLNVQKASLGGEANVIRSFRVAQLDQENDVREVDAPNRQGDDDEKEYDTIIVTGTNIRGIAPESSPVQSYSREDILTTGAATAEDFIRTLTQNFGGGSNQATTSGLPNDRDASSNIGRGSSVNLRGLGSGSTLVLLNGRRMAPSSILGGFADISIIPASAIERIDVLTDGASSIYGADAVAGVVNFVLRDDYDGAEVSARYGTVTEGDLDEYRASFAGGKSWAGGNALAAYEYYERGALSVADRSFSRGAPLPNNLLPSQQRHNILLSASQEITPSLDVSGDFNFSTRESGDVVTAVSNSSSTFLSSRTDTLNASLAGAWEVSENWFLDVSGTYSTVDIENDSNAPASSFESLTKVESEIFTSDLLISGDIFDLPAGAVKLAIGGHVRTEDLIRGTAGISELQSDRDVYAIFGEAFLPIIGPDNAVPGVRRLELNVSGRYSDFSDFGDTANPKVGILWSPVEDVRLRGSYSTSFKPPILGRISAEDLIATVYSTALFNLVAGFTAGDPSIADVTGLSISGTSTDLDPETSRAFTGGVDIDKNWGAHTLSFSASYFDIQFKDRIGATPIPDNTATSNAPNIAINSPELFPEGTVIFNPTLDQINDALSLVVRPIGFFGAADPLDAAFINFAGLRRNLTQTDVRGIDFTLSHGFASDHGVYTLGFGGTYLTAFQQQAAPTTPTVDRRNTQFNPIDLRLRGSLGYAHKGFSANLFVNYADSYEVDDQPGSSPIDSLTTIDLNIAYDAGERFGNAVLDNTVLRLSVQNLFDENPPSTPGAPNFLQFGYDSTNASPLNRFVAFEVTKRL